MGYKQIGGAAPASMVLLLLFACGGATPATQSPPPGDTGDSASTSATALADMHGHFDDVTAIQVALISGNLVAARTLAKQVRLGFAGPVPEGWGPYIERSIASAEMLEVSDDLGMAAQLAGTMANTCGDCHRSQGLVVIEHVAVAPPAEEDPFSNFMLQHRWAADRMWEGLIGPSDAAWRAGAQALQSTELTEADIGDMLIVTPEIASLLVQIRKDAIAAQTLTESEARQELYGRFLSGCASCHRDMQNQRD